MKKRKNWADRFVYGIILKTVRKGRKAKVKKLLVVPFTYEVLCKEDGTTISWSEQYLIFSFGLN